MRRLLVTLITGIVLAALAPHVASAADTGVIKGQVTGGGQPLANAYVSVYALGNEWYPAGSAYTDAQGFYTMPALPLGQYKLQFSSGYQSPYLGEWYDNKDSFSEASVITLTTSDFVANASLARGSLIKGTVTGGGQPLPSTYVTVYDVSYDFVGYSFTDVNGAFVVGAVPPGQYKVEFRNYGGDDYLPEWFDNKQDFDTADTVTTTAGTDLTVNAALSRSSRIVGRVLDQQGDPVSASVKVYRGTGVERSVTTGPDGRFDVGGLRAAKYTVRYVPAGSADVVEEWWDDKRLRDESTIIDLGDEQTFTADAVLSAGATISGTVTDDRGQPVVGATVRAAGPRERFTVTDSSGQYSLKGLEEGVYRVRVRAFADLAAQWYDGAETKPFATLINTQLGKDVAGIDVRLRKARTIQGTVRDVSARPVPYARILVYKRGDTRATATTSSDFGGSFTTKDLEPGEYLVRVEPDDPVMMPEWWNGEDTRAAATPVTVTDTQGVGGLNVTLRKAATIQGVITNESDRPVAARVDVYRVTGDDPVASGSTDQDGRYLVGGLPAGNYEVRFDPRLNEYATQWWDKAPRRNAATTVSLTAGASFTADAKIAAGGTLTGVVTGPGGQPLPGMKVRAYTGPTDYRSRVTDSTGRYTFMGLDDEDYRVQVVPGASRLDLAPEWFEDALGYGTAKPVPVGNGQTVSVNIGMEKGATVSGVVRDAKGPVSGIGVDVFDAQGNKSLTAWTNADGEYTSSALPPGEYKVRFMPGYYGGDGLVEQWWNNKPTAAQSDTITLAKQEQRSGVDATLVPVGDARPPGAPTGVTVTPGDARATITWSAPSDNGGLPITRYSVQGLPSGTCETQGESSCTVGQLKNGVAYTFVVVARNSAGPSVDSLPSSAVVPFGKPKPPTAVTATAATESARVSWTPGADNGRPITKFVATSSPGGKTCSTDTRSCVVPGLSAGTSYTFTVTAENAAGVSDSSSPSSSVTVPANATAPPATGGGGGAPATGSPTPPATGTSPAPVQPPATGAPSTTGLKAPSRITVRLKKRRAAIRWKRVAGATSYQVRVSKVKGKKGRWKSVTTRKVRTAKLKKGRYVIRVRAVGPEGPGPAKKKKLRVR